MEERKELKSPIFILGSHKSGSSLLRSLLDGHPDLFAIPAETHFFEVAGHWIDYGLRAQSPRKIDNKQVINNMINLIEEKNVHDDPFADSVTPNFFNVEKFRSHIFKCLSEDVSTLFSTYLEALYFACHKTERMLPNIRFVEKSVENAEYACTLQKMFPDAYFVHIVRNPYACIKSIRKSKLKYGYPYLGRIIQALENSYYNLYKNESLLGKLLIVKYEDLISDPNNVMKTVAEFLCVDFKEILVRPTLMGKSWPGNSTSGLKFSDISKQPVASWDAEIEPIEVYLVNQFLPHIVERFGYPKINTSFGKTFLPAKKENIKTYIKNRSFEISLAL